VERRQARTIDQPEPRPVAQERRHDLRIDAVEQHPERATALDPVAQRLPAGRVGREPVAREHEVIDAVEGVGDRRQEPLGHQQHPLGQAAQVADDLREPDDLGVGLFRLLGDAGLVGVFGRGLVRVNRGGRLARRVQHGPGR
jgi:hypothetical protein